MDWELIIKIAATVVIVLVALGILAAVIETTSQPSDPGTGY